jgi:hypothetical protein
MAIFPGRYSAQIDGPFVVFLIGMRINRLWQFWKWMPVMSEMPAMLKELATHPEKGMLAFHTVLTWRGVAVIQYWRSFEHLERFARAPSDPHLEAWRRFNKKVGGNGAVGIWHETYRVDAKAYECIYGNMPRFGLASAGQHLPAVGRLSTAKGRLTGEESEPAVPP